MHHRTRTSSTSATPDLQHTRLPCGARVVTEHVPGARSVAVGLMIDTGSRDEPVERSGISHFVEHMVFKGTHRRRAHHIAQRMEAVGGYLNAFTEKEVTCYYGRALPEHAARAIDAVVDLALRPSFPVNEVAREQGVVFEELKLYDDTPEEAALDLYDRAMYPGHGLGRPVLGSAETVGALTQEALHAFVAAHYVPERMVLAAVGAVDHAQVCRAATRAFADADRATAEAPSREEAPALTQTRREVLPRPVQQAHVVLGVRALAMDDERRHALTLLHTALGAGMSSRLNRQIREMTGACYAIYSFANAYTDTGDLGVYAGMDPMRLDRMIPRIWREMTWFASHAMPARVLQRVKNQARGEWLLGLESLSNRMVYIARHMLYHGDLPSATAEADGLQAVSAEAVQTLAQELFMDQPSVEVRVLPADNAQPVAI